MASTTYIFARPHLEPVLEKNYYELIEPWHVRTPYGDFTVPAGFTYDGASIPRFFWRVTGGPFQSPRCIAALLHDYLYATHKVDRATADKIYRDMQIALGIAKYKARIEYRVLRIFGGLAWRKHGTMSHFAALACLAAISLLLDGCASKTRTIDLAGMYASESGLLAIGEVEVMAAPQGEESATIKYTEDNAWLQPSMKKHNIKIMLTGSNSVEKVDAIVKNICYAFTEVADKRAAAPKAPEAPEENDLTKKGENND